MRDLKQAYVLPIRGGWGVITYGDQVLVDDEIMPLPLTSNVTYGEAIAFVRGLEIGSGLVDGWATLESLWRLEPSLAQRLSS